MNDLCNSGCNCDCAGMLFSLFGLIFFLYFLFSSFCFSNYKLSSYMIISPSSCSSMDGFSFFFLVKYQLSIFQMLLGSIVKAHADMLQTMHKT